MKLSVRTQLLIWFTFLLLLGGTLATVLLAGWLTADLSDEMIERAKTLGHSLAMWSEEAVLTENRIELSRLVSETQAASADVEYIYLIDARGVVLAHTFADGGMPGGLRKATAGRPMTRLSTERGPVRDIAASILGGRGGEVHVGYSESGILANVGRLRTAIWLIALPVFLLGTVAIWFLSGVLTRPISRLTHVVERFGAGDLDARTGGRFRGEIGTLAAAFDQMAENLQRQADELRYLTEYIQNLIDNLGVGVYVLDRDFVVQFANRELVREVGEVRGRLCHDVICRQKEPCAGCVALHSRDHGKVHRRTCRLPDGRWIEQTAIPLTNVGGEVATIVTRRDITDDIRLREKMTRHEKLAAIGELAAVVAHEVNNPLDGIHGLVRLVRDEPGIPEESRRHLDMISDGLTRLEMIVRRLLTFTADQAEPSLLTTVAEQLDRAESFLGKRLMDSGVVLERRLRPEPVPVRVDPNRFPQVLVNLILNAVDAMPEGGRLTIRETAADGEACLHVEDQGPGVPEELRERIFRPFFSTKGPGKGTGLGLAISRRIVEGHHGSLRVEEAPGGGAAFVICLPVADAGDQTGSEESE